MTPVFRTVSPMVQAAVALLGLLLVACEPGRSAPPMRQVPGGNAALGREALARYGCGGCHVIPGIPAARSLVGPPLTHYGQRGFVAGVVSNSADNLIKWIVDPPAVDPQTAMPRLGVTPTEARHMAAYLYTVGGADY